MTFTIEFMRVRESDNAHAPLDRVATLDMPQAPDALRILDEEGRELFF